ncbi:hypothetical protein [Oscillibacter sp.]|uniref:hypothetical protein n=1 Tax=Oscillibacter sp. TaxID=1945593 RepID=UPI0028A02C5B|nr:hypothetical protein [Oscillibacter sp.]
MKVQDVFDKAIRLMDEQNESTGVTVTADTKEYLVRTPDILDSILARVSLSVGSPYVRVAAATDEIQLDDAVTSGVLPYYLASALIAIEAQDSVLAAYFSKAGDAALAVIGARLSKAEPEPVEDVYGGLEYGEFARW